MEQDKQEVDKFSFPTEKEIEEALLQVEALRKEKDAIISRYEALLANNSK